MTQNFGSGDRDEDGNFTEPISKSSLDDFFDAIGSGVTWDDDEDGINDVEEVMDDLDLRPEVKKTSGLVLSERQKRFWKWSIK